ncbi:MAG: TIGR04283 family arsenosugar biosynthesis glycosyltransferase [Candidatus Competibacteraceae bacterium]|nr:TIGR04283 family arsenosugar biosynthesis glycosyltransferase [Candidatus Competibacteraceae bacterium]
MSDKLSIIIPVLDEGPILVTFLRELQFLRERNCELIVADGGSGDGSPGLARPLADRVLVGERGRARQMNAAAAVARGEILWFLHADSRIPAEPDRSIRQALAEGRLWGRFDVRLSGRRPLLRVVETLINWRSCLSGVASGDQGIFVDRATFQAVGGYPDIPLMEDVALSLALRRRGWPACLKDRLITSSRRWERDGIWRTIFLMWRLRLAYALGADPSRLARLYNGG